MGSTPSTECGRYHDDLAVLSVGALTGHDRAQVLAHLDGCPSCTAELEELTRTADSLTTLIPQVTPPDGFAERTMARIRAERRDRRPSLFRRSVAVAAAVILLAVGGGVSALIDASIHHAPATAMATAPLLSRHGTEGSVVLVSSGGKGWLAMTVDDAAASGVVTCRLALTDGSHRTVGTFKISYGYGSWTAPIAVPVPSVQWVDLVDSRGGTVASARIG
jgi:anti-sigma factor RsiW